MPNLNSPIEIIVKIEQDISLAKKLMGIVASAGIQSVKFPLSYGVDGCCELSKMQAFDLFDRGNKLDIDVFFSICNKEQVDWCREMDVKRIGIEASQSDNLELIKYASQNDMPLLISTYSMPFKLPSWILSYNYDWLYSFSQDSTKLNQIAFGLTGRDELEFVKLHGDYDAKLERLGRDSKIVFAGLSDNTIGLDVAKIALSRGARIIEKPFSLNHDKALVELTELLRFKKVIEEAL